MTPAEVATVEDALHRWAGAGAYIWSYTVSHRELTIRVQRPGERSNLHIVCTGCSYLQGRPVWRDSRLSLERLAAPEERAQYVLQDEVGQFRAVFTSATVEFDVAPMHVA